ncbi:MAG: 3-oxoacyl-ACP reductase FabG [Deltaproteobacteria bacterium]|nr:3-oxoacyl-ACP reductase FabG [Deltaproteobacteria bacterium]
MSERPVALVTGGAGGIGAACCRALAREGLRVGVGYRSSAQAAKALGEEIDGFLVPGDVAVVEDVEKMIATVKDAAGRLDVLVNNAAVNVNGAFMMMPLEDIDKVRAVTRGTMLLTKLAIRRFMFRQRSGRIINISSVVGHQGNAGQVPYTMEKAGLDAMTRSLALELTDRGILVNSVAPGFIDTAMTAGLPDDVKETILRQIPLGRMGRPEEVAEVVAFLATKASYVTGTVVHVNGGLYRG